MDGASESRGTGGSLPRVCESGALAGGALGLLRVLVERDAIDSLPADHQARLVLVLWAAWVGVGVGLALVTVALRSALPGLRVVPVIVAAFLGVEVGWGGLGLRAGGEPAVVAAAALAVAWILHRAVARAPWIASPAVWSVGGSLCGALLARDVFLSSGAGHGMGLGFRVLLAVPVAASALHAVVRAWGTRLAPLAGAVALLAVAVAALAPGFAGDPGAAERPNVLLVTVDTLRADAVGVYGAADARTPSIDRLAGEGVLFSDAQSPVPMTYPAHTSLFTGQYPGTHGVLNNMPWPIPTRTELLSERLAREGYRTAAFVSGFTLKRNASRLHQRFQLYDDTFGPLRVVPDVFCDTGLVSLARAVAERLGKTVRRLRYGGDRPADRAVDSAVEWLERAGSEPFLLWVHLFDPHLPYEPPPRFVELHDPESASRLGGSWYRVPPERKSEIVRSPEDVERLRALYRGEVSFADAEVGRLLAALEASGHADDTLVVLTSDHGESLGEHDYWFDHSYFLYETCTSIPLVMRFPAGDAPLPAGSRVDAQVRLVDLAPTLAEWLELEPVEQKVDGVSLLPLLRREQRESGLDVAFSATYDLRPDGRRYLMAVRDGRFKLVRTQARWDDLWFLPGGDVLYDLERDPGETRDASAAEPEAYARLREQLDRLWEAWAPGDASGAGALSADDQERLGDIGY